MSPFTPHARPLSAAGAGNRTLARPDESGRRQTANLLGIATINFQQGKERLAIIDTPLQG